MRHRHGDADTARDDNAGVSAPDPAEVTAVVLAGGASRRFGTDKLAAPLGESSVLDRTLDGLPDVPIVCVGPPRRTRRGVTWVRERPPGTGPLAGIVAALEAITTPVTVVVAGDMPYAGALASRLAAALVQVRAEGEAAGEGGVGGGRDVSGEGDSGGGESGADPVEAVAVLDGEGHTNPLLAAYDTAALRRVMPTDAAGVPAKHLLRHLRHRTVAVTDGRADDVDTEADLERLARRAVARTAYGGRMRAITIPEPGGPDALVLAEVDTPEPGSGAVRIRVAAAGVNRADVMQRMGHYPPPKGESEVPGLEVSGTVDAVGEGVTGWAVGDEVCALLAGGGYAEQVVVPAGQVLPVPAGVSLVDAAALPEVVCTVWSNVFLTANLQPGEVLLVHGGSSGIGTMATQLAREVGARVAVTAGSAAKLERCRELGAEILVNYREQDFVEQVKAATDGAGANVILDNMGAKYLARNVDALATAGRLVVIGLQGGRSAELNLGALLSKRAAVIATSLRARPPAEKATIVAAVREHVWPLIEAGRVRPVVHATFPLGDAAEAHRTMEGSSHIGKLLLVA